MSPSASTLTPVMRPVKANQRCSEAIRFELRVIPALMPTPGQLNIREGVIGVIFDLSAGTRSESVLAGQRSTPCCPVILHGETNVTLAAVDFPKAEKTARRFKTTVASMIWEFIPQRPT